jgi:hypothetical protein
MAGYSGTPLVQKLGIVDGSRLLVLHEPAEFQAALGELPANAKKTSSFGGSSAFDVAVVFVRTKGSLERAFGRVAARMTPAGGVWIAWPKQTSGVETDLTENVLRKVLLPTGWVDNKVCAIDERWSGLRFVLRKELRPAAGTSAAPRGSKASSKPTSRRPS